MADVFTILVDGTPIEARRGESLAGAMVGAGLHHFRTTATGAERGIYCGMGVCQECLVEVNGCPNQRACMTKVEKPMTVCREAHRRPLNKAGDAVRGVTKADIPIERLELLVIGAGPAGLSAAIAARRAGADVVIVDERTAPGGQYYKQVAIQGEDVVPPDGQQQEGSALIGRARELGVRLMLNTLVWGAFEHQEFVVTAPEGIRILRPRRTIVATGAYERGWPVPGWTLPGVMTSGAAQTLWRTARRLPGRKVMIAGNGPLNLQLAAELHGAGAEIVALVEAAPRPDLGAIRSLASMATTSPSVFLNGLRYASQCLRSGIPMHFGRVIKQIDTVSDGLLITTESAEGDSAEAFKADVLCLGYGFEPSNELLRAIGCGHDFDPTRSHLTTRRDAFGRTDVDGVFAVGDCTGLGGARAALAEGFVAGLQAASDLCHDLPTDLALEARSVERQLSRDRHFQKALWSLYAPSRSNAPITPDTVVCRCEEVTFAQIERALASGFTGIGDVKRSTRAGMGACQGRYCGPVLQALLSAQYGARDEFSGFAPRLPVKPVAIADFTRLPPS